MTPELRIAKAQHKHAKRINPVKYKEKRDELVMYMLSQPAPNWGSLILKIEPL